MPFNSKRVFSLIALAVVLLLSGCGGGNDPVETPIAITRMSAADRALVQGDWNAPFIYYSATDQTNWDYLWAQRKGLIDCSKPFNEAACKSDRPPAVDFKTHMVVGVYMGRVFRFADPADPIRAFEREGKAYVRFKSIDQTKSPASADTAPDVEFVLLPAKFYAVIEFGPDL